jgi:hypothetical protein
MIWQHFALDVAYVGLHGVDTAAQYNLNGSTTTLGTGTAGQPLNMLYGKTAGATLFWDGFSSSYNALQVKLDRHFRDFVMTTAFTWGKGMDFQGGDDGGLMWLIDAQRNYARTDWDRTLSFVQSYVYELPAGKGKKWLNSGPASWVLGNWQLSGILTLMTGTPMTFGASGSSLNTPGESQTANQVAPVQILQGINAGNPWFSQASFAQPTGAAFGTTGRNILNGPGLFSLNLSLFKDFKIGDRIGVQLRCETFNFTNTPELGNPSTGLTSSTFGYVTGTIGSGTGVNGTGGGRAVQLGAKVTF